MARLEVGVSLRYFAVASLALVLFSWASPKLAQSQTDPNAGIIPFSTHEFGIDLATGNITTTIPVRNKTGKIPFSYAIVSNNQAYTTASGSSTSWNVTTGFYGSPTGPAQLIGVGLQYTKNGINCNGGSFWTHLAVSDSTGASHPFGASFEINTCSSAPLSAATTTDGSGYTLVVSNQESGPWTLYDKSGNNVNLLAIETELSWAESDPDNVSLHYSAGGTPQIYTDTLNTTALTATMNYSNEALGDTYTYTDASGNDQSYSVSYTNFTVGTAFACTGIKELAPASRYLPTTITTPTGAKYQISYESTASGYTGRIAKIAYPSGGSIQYTYSGGNNGITCASGVVPLLTVTTNDNKGNTAVWTYANSNTGTGNFTVTKTDPAGNQTVYTFAGEYQTQAAYYHGSASGTPLKKVITCYNANFSSCATAPSVITPTQTDVYTSFNGGPSNLVETKYDSYGNVIEVARYDFGVNLGAAPTAKPLSNTLNYYGQTWNGSTSSPACSPYPAGTYINDTPCYSHTENSAGTDVARTQIAYSATGHPTSTSRWASGSTWLASTALYNANGTVQWTKDAAGNQTSYAYNGTGGCNGLLPTSVTYPLIGAEYFTWDCNGGVLLTDKDVNKQTTTYAYNDPLWRQTQISNPDGGSTTTTYNTGAALPWSISTSTTITASSNLTKTTVLDGLGRTTQTQLTSDPDGVDYVDTTYDLLGRTASVSNPYRSKTEGTYGITQYSYDALSRMTNLQHPDGTSISTTYTGRATEVSDEGNGNKSVQRISQIDGLGRLVDVCELTTQTVSGNITPTPSACNLDITPATGFLTSYTYDALNNILSVSQGGLNGRSFQYDGLSRLAVSQNPESGTITYNYNSAGDLYQRVAPEPNQTGTTQVTTTYTYDALHRLTGKSYSDGTPGAGYYYDQPSPWGVTATNYMGRLTQTYADNGLAGSAFSYDSMGRVAHQWQCTPLTCGMTSVYLTFTYDLMGDLTSSNNNGDGVTYSNNYDAAARLTSVQSSLSDSQHPGTLVTYGGYNALQKPDTITLGNGIVEDLAYSNRGWLYSIGESPNTYGFNIYNWSSKTLGFAPNGNILYSNDSANSNWAYTYDDMNRLTQATCTANADQCPAVQGLTYSYDRFGNRWTEKVTAGMGIQPAYNYNAKNQIDISGVTYDAAGDVTNDGYGFGNTYYYDAENRIIQVNGTMGQCSTATACYVYDALGHRVRATVSGQTRDFVYDLSGRTIDEFTPGGSGWLGTWTRGEAYAGNMHIATYANGTTQFDNSDWLGTFRARSDVSGNLVESCSSMPFGEDLTCTGTELTPIHFTGKEHDFESGNDFFPARYYSSGPAHFLTPDPGGLNVVDPSNPQSWNQYAYVMNNPVIYTDPSGLDYSLPNLNRIYSFDAVSNDGNTYMIDGLQVSQAAFLGQLDFGNGAGGGEFWAAGNDNGHWAPTGGGIGCDGPICAVYFVDWSANLPNLDLIAANNQGAGGGRKTNLQNATCDNPYPITNDSAVINASYQNPPPDVTTVQSFFPLGGHCTSIAPNIQCYFYDSGGCSLTMCAMPYVPFVQGAYPGIWIPKKNAPTTYIKEQVCAKIK
jgi:RHS repeat-associated protein